MNCIICNKGINSGTILMTVQVHHYDRVTACPDHLREAISLTDIKPLTDVEWRRVAQGFLDGFADIKSGDDHG